MRYLFIVLFYCFISLNAWALSYASIDTRAKDYGNKYVNNLDKLTDELVRPYKYNQKATARVIFAWIALHTQYDKYEYQTDYEDRNAQKYGYNHQKYVSEDGLSISLDAYNNSPHDVFKSRLGVCRDFARLFVYMARRAGLDAVMITGMAGKTKDSFSPHAWNAVLIDNKWYLLDVTWAGMRHAMENIETDEEYVKAVNERRKNKDKIIKGVKIHKTNEKTIIDNKNEYILKEDNTLLTINDIDNEWFLTPPMRMYKTHRPDNKKWRLFEKAKIVNGIPTDRLLYDADYNKKTQRPNTNIPSNQQNLFSLFEEPQSEEESDFPIELVTQLMNSNLDYKSYQNIFKQSIQQQKTDIQNRQIFKEFINLFNQSVPPINQNNNDKNDPKNDHKTQPTNTLNIPSLSNPNPVSETQQQNLERYQKFFDALKKQFNIQQQ